MGLERAAPTVVVAERVGSGRPASRGPPPRTTSRTSRLEMQSGAIAQVFMSGVAAHGMGNADAHLRLGGHRRRWTTAMSASYFARAGGGLRGHHRGRSRTPSSPGSTRGSGTSPSSRSDAGAVRRHPGRAGHPRTGRRSPTGSPTRSCSTRCGSPRGRAPVGPAGGCACRGRSGGTSVSGQTVLVTGAAQGLGAAIARHLHGARRAPDPDGSRNAAMGSERRRRRARAPSSPWSST